MAEVMDSNTCPTFILATKGSYSDGRTTLFRSYRCKL